MPPDERMDVDAQLELLNEALRLQHRSVLHYSLTAGSVIGLEYQAHAERMRAHARAELADATRLVEKITALGGEPTTQVAPLSFNLDPAAALDRLVEAEGQALEALQAAIEPTGREAASEAVVRGSLGPPPRPPGDTGGASADPRHRTRACAQLLGPDRPPAR
jgi:bacterioferritin (cytochrome b1)